MQAKHTKRFELMQQIGCIACLIEADKKNEKRWIEPSDVHHLLHAGKRISHDHTIALCPWHHRKVSKNWTNDRVMRDLFGPSLADGAPEFAQRYGTDIELLEFQNQLMKLHSEMWG